MLLTAFPWWPETGADPTHSHPQNDEPQHIYEERAQHREGARPRAPRYTGTDEHSGCWRFHIPVGWPQSIHRALGVLVSQIYGHKGQEEPDSSPPGMPGTVRSSPPSPSSPCVDRSTGLRGTDGPISPRHSRTDSICWVTFSLTMCRCLSWDGVTGSRAPVQRKHYVLAQQGGGAFRWGDPTGRAAGPEAALTLSDLDEAEQDDQGQRQELGGSKGVLDPRGGLHAVAVHGREQHCGGGAESEPAARPARQWALVCQALPDGPPGPG